MPYNKYVRVRGRKDPRKHRSSPGHVHREFMRTQLLTATQNQPVPTAGSTNIGSFNPSTEPIITQTFLLLTDTPAGYGSQAGNLVRVNGTEDALEFVAPTFLNLSDTPASYSGQGSKIVAVNVGESGLEFIDAPTVAETFTDLTDTPAGYGSANQVAKSNGTNALTWGWVDYTELTSVPATFPPSSHSHDNTVGADNTDVTFSWDAGDTFHWYGETADTTALIRTNIVKDVGGDTQVEFTNTQTGRECWMFTELLADVRQVDNDYGSYFTSSTATQAGTLTVDVTHVVGATLYSCGYIEGQWTGRYFTTLADSGITSFYKPGINIYPETTDLEFFVRISVSDLDPVDKVYLSICNESGTEIAKVDVKSQITAGTAYQEVSASFDVSSYNGQAVMLIVTLTPYDPSSLTWAGSVRARVRYFATAQTR